MTCAAPKSNRPASLAAWPRAASAARKGAGQAASIISSPPSSRQRGASIAACGFWPLAKQAGGKLEVALRLHRAAHHAEGCDRHAVPRGKAGNDRVEGLLARPDLIGVARLEDEAASPVVHGDAGSRHHDARAEAAEVRLDVGNHHAAGVGGGEIDGLAAMQPAGTGGGGALAIDELGAHVEIVRREQLVCVERHGGGIGDMLGDIGDAELHRFDLEVLHLDAVGIEGGEVEAVEDAEGDQRRQALPVGRYLVQPVAFEIDGKRRHPVGRVRGKIGERHGAAGLRRMPPRSPRRAGRDRRPRPCSRR